MPDASAFQEPLPDLPSGWHGRIPAEDDLPTLVRLRAADHAPFTGEAGVDEAAVRSEVVGQASWTRRQLVVDPRRRPAARLGLGTGPGRRPDRRSSLWLERDPDAVDDAAGWPPRCTPGRTAEGPRSPGCGASSAHGWTLRRSPTTRCSAAGSSVPATHAGVAGCT